MRRSKIRGSGSVDAFHGDGLLDAQFLDRSEESFGVDVQAIPGFLPQEDHQAAADFVEGVLPRHGDAGQTFVERGRGSERVMGAGHLERVAHPVDIFAELPDLPSAVFLDEVARQTAGNPAAVGPLAAPAGQQIAGFRLVGEGE